MKRPSLSPRNNKCIVTVLNPLVENSQDIECRICFESDGKLLKVCSCSGSIEHVHIKCIKKWIETFPKNHPNHYYCDICHQKYHLNYGENDLENYNDPNHFCKVTCFTFLFIFFVACIIILIAFNY